MILRPSRLLRLRPWVRSACGVALTALALAAQATTYGLIVLPAPVDQAMGNAINNAGTITGQGFNGVSDYVGLVWQGDTVSLLTVPPGSTGSQGTAINASGTVAGMGWSTSTVRATVWTHGVATVLPTGGVSSHAAGINDAGVVVGTLFAADGTIRGAQWTGGTLAELAPLGTQQQTRAYDINNAGLVVGTSSTASGDEHATVWQSGVPLDLGTLTNVPGSLSVAFAVNEDGLVVGSSSLVRPGGTPIFHPFAWQNGVMVDLAGSDSGDGKAWAVNEQGQVVGDWNRRGMLWDGGAAYDLNSLLDPRDVAAGWVVTGGRSINDRGQIVASATNAILGAADSYAVLLTAVPEPATAGLLAAGLLGLTAVRRRPRSLRAN